MTKTELIEMLAACLPEDIAVKARARGWGISIEIVDQPATTELDSPPPVAALDLDPALLIDIDALSARLAALGLGLSLVAVVAPAPASATGEAVRS